MAFEPLAANEAIPQNALVDGKPPDAEAEDRPTPVRKPERAHAKLLRWADLTETPNIAKELSDKVLGEIGIAVLREYEIDETSRKAWLETAEKATELAMQVVKPKDTPWPKASNFIYPLVTVAATSFAARAYPAIIAGPKVVKGIVIGDDKGKPAIDPQTGQQVMGQGENGPEPAFIVPPGEKRRRADRIGDHMSWQLLEEMPEWEEETDKKLHILPIVGCSFRKSYFDPQRGINVSCLVWATKLTVNYWARTLETAQRITEEIKIYPIEIEERKRAGTFLDHDYPPPGTEGDDNAPHEFLEQHRTWDLDEDGYPEPYIVTVHKQSGKIARIIARYDADGIHVSNTTGKIARIEPVQYYTKYDFLPNPEGGFYGIGFGQLLNHLNEGINSSINMMFDAEHQRLAGGGFIGRGLSMHAGSVRRKMGEYRPVNATGSTIRDAIVNLEFPEASPILFQLLGLLIQAGKEIASIKDILSGEPNLATMQPTTVLALIEQGLKTFTWIYKRIHRAAKKEYDKLYRLNRIYMEEQKYYQVGDDWREIKREDYAEGSGVAPISDPTMISDMQKLTRASLLQLYQNDPHCNPIGIRRRIFEDANIEDIDEIIVTQPPQPPPDPLLLVEQMRIEENRPKMIAEIGAKKAEEVRNLTAAIKNMAEVDEKISEDQRAWVAQQWDILKQLTQGADRAATGQPAQQLNGGGGSAPAGVPAELMTAAAGAPQ